MPALSDLRRRIRHLHLSDEDSVLDSMVARADIGDDTRTQVSREAAKLVQDIRDDDQPGLMEVFLAEYGLSTDEGVALMCLAEALLRVPDSETIDDLIEDKIAPSSWGVHLGKSSSSLVNASTWALMLTGKVLDDDDSKGVGRVLHSAVKRLGEPVIRVAVKRAMREMGNQFVLGETITDAIRRGESKRKKGFSYSYDMLGEAALTAHDAQNFYGAYENAMAVLAGKSHGDDIRENPGISIKLSALHPRYELGQKHRVMRELVPRVLALSQMAKAANMGLNIDAEEADRLDLSLDIIEAVLRDPSLEGWDGFGVVVQAYSKRASAVIDWLYALASELDRKIMVRLVKGAYWDSEIKRAQVEGTAGFPVFTRKSATDVSYMCCAKTLLSMTDRIYPQFATHNAHSVAAVLEMAPDKDAFEFQALHGMGEVMHRLVLGAQGTRCRIYAPVGAHRDLLAYLVRRLLENGANSSFVNQIVDETVPPEAIAADPFVTLAADRQINRKHIIAPKDLFAPDRVNSKGWDLHNTDDVAALNAARGPFLDKLWSVKPMTVKSASGGPTRDITNPANPDDAVGSVIEASADDVSRAVTAAKPWRDSPQTRQSVLCKAADLFETNTGEFLAVLTREAGKVPADAISELREAVDFLRYYAAEIARIGMDDTDARGIISCISPWNFPLAIFTGQIAAALAAGNAVLAKPAETTPIVAALATTLLHKAGVPKSALQLLPGEGGVVGAAMTGDPKVSGVVFTGSTVTAQIINRAMAKTAVPDAPLIAETGGLNAMIVDSTALLEQAVKDVVASAFQSAGQRCSALRILYVQTDIADDFLKMLFGAMDEQTLGNPWDLSTDIGPIIDADAKAEMVRYIDTARAEGRLLKQLDAPIAGHFVGPAVISVGGLSELESEVFGPVLHVARFKASHIPSIVTAINDSGYGLTLGLHTRIDDRVEQLTQTLDVGNIYINRNQIGAVVQSQPFGGEGVSGTGPKAGGPHYVQRFLLPPQLDGPAAPDDTDAAIVTAEQVEAALSVLHRKHFNVPLTGADQPGPTGENNRLSTYGRGRILCLGPTLDQAQAQADIARQTGCQPLIICHNADGEHSLDGRIEPSVLRTLRGFDGVAYWGGGETLRAMREALAARDGAILPLMCAGDMAARCVIERHVCIDTTASGGNVALLAAE